MILVTKDNIMFLNVRNFQMNCIKCENRIKEFETDVEFRRDIILEISPEDITNMYAQCDCCDELIEFDRTEQTLITERFPDEYKFKLCDIINLGFRLKKCDNEYYTGDNTPGIIQNMYKK